MHKGPGSAQQCPDPYEFVYRCMHSWYKQGHILCSPLEPSEHVEFCHNFRWNHFWQYPVIYQVQQYKPNYGFQNACCLHCASKTVVCRPGVVICPGHFRCVPWNAYSCHKCLMSFRFCTMLHSTTDVCCLSFGSCDTRCSHETQQAMGMCTLHCKIGVYE